MAPEISILIPVYNVETYIAQCLESLLANTIIDRCEIIICNDCTPDNSMAVIDPLLKQHQDITVKIITHTENKKIAVTRQDLLDAATGKYILFVDSDDWVEPDYLEKLYTAAEKNNADIATCNIIKEYVNKTVKCRQALSDSQNQNIVELITAKTPGYSPSKLLRRSVITENKISFIADLIICEDTLFLLKYYTHTSKVTNTDTPLYHYRIISSHAQFSDTRAEERIKGVQKIEEYLDSTDRLNQYASEIAYRKIFVLLKFLPYAPFSKCRKYYSCFTDISRNLKTTGAKGLFYRGFAKALDKQNFFLCNMYVFLSKIRLVFKNFRTKRM